MNLTHPASGFGLKFFKKEREEDMSETLKKSRGAGNWLLGGMVLILCLGVMPLRAAGADNADAGDSASLSQAQLDAINKAVDEKLAASKGGPTVAIHGFAELDVIGDDSQSFKDSVGNTAVALPGTTSGDNGQMVMSARDTRLGFAAQMPEMDGWKGKGYVEIDFFGLAASSTTTPEASFYTTPAIRLRHAYVDAQKDGWDILAGQYWSLFGWQCDFMLGSMTPSLALPGDLFERTPQVRVSKTLGIDGDSKVQLAVSADRPEESASKVPNFNGGIRLTLGGMKARYSLPIGAVNSVPFSIGLSGTLRSYTYGAPASVVSLNQSAQGQAVAVDTIIPLLPVDDSGNGPSLVLAGEWTIGNGDADQMFGWTGGLGAMSAGTTFGASLDAGVAGYTPAGSFTLVDIQSWNGQLQFHLPKDWASFITAGYGETFSDNVANLKGATFNDNYVLFANVVHDFNSNIRAGVEYDRFDTHYVAGTGYDALDHRVMAAGWYRF